MWLSISVRFTLKNPPAGHRGQVGEHVTWAKKAAMTFYGMAKAVLEEILDWYSLFAGAADLEKDRDRLVEWLQGIQFVEPEKGESDGGQRTR